MEAKIEANNEKCEAFQGTHLSWIEAMMEACLKRQRPQIWRLQVGASGGP
jgi:hypothetical protein